MIYILGLRFCCSIWFILLFLSSSWALSFGFSRFPFSLSNMPVLLWFFDKRKGFKFFIWLKNYIYKLTFSMVHSYLSIGSYLPRDILNSHPTFYRYFGLFFFIQIIHSPISRWIIILTLDKKSFERLSYFILSGKNFMYITFDFTIFIKNCFVNAPSPLKYFNW